VFLGGSSGRHGLAGMGVIGQAVDDGDGGVGGSSLSLLCSNTRAMMPSTMPERTRAASGVDSRCPGRFHRARCRWRCRRGRTWRLQRRRGCGGEGFSRCRPGSGLRRPGRMAGLLELLLEAQGHIEKVAQKVHRRIEREMKSIFGFSGMRHPEINHQDHKDTKEFS